MATKIPNIKNNRAKLSIALKISNDINNLKDSLLSLRLTSGINRASLSGIPRATRDVIAPAQLILELEDKIKERKEDFKIEKEIVKRIIEDLNLLEKEKELLKYRYVNCRAWKEVSILMGLSRSRVHHQEREILGKIYL